MKRGYAGISKEDWLKWGVDQKYLPSRGIDEHHVAIMESARFDDNLSWCSICSRFDHSSSLQES